MLKKKKEPTAPGTRQITAPRPGSIAEHIAKGGKLPGEKGSDRKAIEADVAQRKAELKGEEKAKKNLTEAITKGKEELRAKPIPEAGRTPAPQIPFDAVDIRTERDGSRSYRGADDLIHIVFNNGMEIVEQPGLASPIIAEDIIGLVQLGAGGLLTKGTIMGLSKSATTKAGYFEIGKRITTPT